MACDWHKVCDCAPATIAKITLNGLGVVSACNITRLVEETDISKVRHAQSQID